MTTGKLGAWGPAFARKCEPQRIVPDNIKELPAFAKACGGSALNILQTVV